MSTDEIGKGVEVAGIDASKIDTLIFIQLLLRRHLMLLLDRSLSAQSKTRKTSIYCGNECTIERSGSSLLIQDKIHEPKPADRIGRVAKLRGYAYFEARILSNSH